MTTEISIKDHKVFPEYLIATGDTTTLVGGQSTLYKFKNVEEHDQIVKILGYGVEQVTGVNIQPVVDSQRRNVLYSKQLPSISTDYEVFGMAHELEFVQKEFLLTGMNNTGSSSTDFRSRITYIVDAFDTMRKLALGHPLSARDREAMAILKRRQDQGLQGFNAEEALKLGIGYPKTFEDFLKIHETIGSVQSSLPDSTNLSTTRSIIMDEFVSNPGKEALVLEGLFLERPAQSELGEVVVYISRDGDADIVTFDPACLKGDNVRLDLHIHAFKELKVEVALVTGTHNAYKASAIATRRRVGIGFKAKMEEFLGKLPAPLEIDETERAIINDKNLKEYARVGAVSIG